MFRVTITASLASKPHFIEAAKKLEAAGARRVRVDQYDTKQRHPKSNSTMAAARLRFAVESKDEMKEMVKSAGLEGYGTLNAKQKFDNSDDEEE